MDEGLRQKAISGAKWRVLAAYSTQAIQAATAIVLAWLLDPGDYGLAAAAMAVIAILRACGSVGVNYALIHRRDRVEEASNTALVLLLFTAALSYLVLLVVAPLSRAYADDPRLIWALGLLFFLRPVALVTEGTLQREFHFRRLFLVEFSSVVLSAGVAIGLGAALPKGHRYWALALSGLARETARSIMGWLCAHIRPKLAFDWGLAKELLHYGKYFVGSAIVMALYGNIDRLALRELLSPAALGLYAFAFAWVFRVGDLSETIFGGVALPVYAKLQDDVGRLRASFRRIVRLSALVSTGLLTGMILLVPDAVSLVFPARWRPAIPIFQALGLYYMVRAIDTTTGQLYASVGRPKYNMYLSIVNLAVMSATVVPFVLWWGPVGAAWCLVVARLVTLACNAFVCRSVLHYSMMRPLGIVTPAVKASASMALVVGAGLLAVLHLDGEVGWLALAGLIALGAGSYALALYVLERELFRDVVGLVRDAVRGRRVRISGSAS